MEKTEYAVLRFVSQNNYCHIVHDYVQGHSIMEYAKENVKLDKKKIFALTKELAKQMEKFYMCESEVAYGAVNPYAIIVTENDSVVLLDIWAEENKEILVKMQKKKVRTLFIRPEYVLSQKKRREDDLYGFGKTTHFFVEQCCGKNVFTYKEERILKKIYEKCIKGDKADIGRWKGIQRLLDKVLEEKKEKKGYIQYLKIVVLLLLAFIGGIWARWQLEPPQQEGVVPDPVEVEDKFALEKANAYFEIGLLYLMEEKEGADVWLERAAEYLDSAENYRMIYGYLQKETLEEEEKENLRSVLDDEKTELEERDGDLYKTPFLRAYMMVDDYMAWEEIIHIGNTMETTVEVKKYLAEANEKLGNYEAAIVEYEELKQMYNTGKEIRAVYEKLMELYDLVDMPDKVKENYEEVMEMMPKLENDEEFMKKKELYGIEIEAIGPIEQETPEVIS